MPVYPSGGTQNTYLEQIEASEDLRIKYIRSAQSFPLSRWTKTRTVNKMKGKYFRLGVDQFYRISAATLNEARWPDGKRFPRQTGNTEAYELKDFETERFGLGFELGALGVEQAEWDVIRDHADGTFCRMMTLRAQRAITEATTSANLEGNTATVATINGASGRAWDDSDDTKLYIKKSINYAVKAIMLAARGSVSVEDLKIVMNPDLADVISVSPEIVALMKYQEGAKYGKEMRGRNAHFGLPDVLYGCELVIEDTVKTTSYKGDTSASDWVFPDDTALVCVRKGGATNDDAVETDDSGKLKPAYDSVQILEYKGQGLSIQTRYDDWNKIHEGKVEDNSDIRLTAPRNSYLLTACLT